MKGEAWEKLKELFPNLEKDLIYMYIDKKMTLREIVKYYNQFLESFDLKISREIISRRLKNLGVKNNSNPNMRRNSSQYKRMAQKSIKTNYGTTTEEKIKQLELKSSMRIRDLLIKLHIEENKTIGEIIRILEDKYRIKFSRSALLKIFKKEGIEVKLLDRSNFMRKKNIENWNNKEYREKMLEINRSERIRKIKSEAAIRQWKNDDGTLAKKLMRANGSRENKLENRFRELLEKFNIPYEYHKKIPTPEKVLIPDFVLFENVVVEVQGDYWHFNPKRIKDNKRVSLISRVKADYEKYKLYKALGYNVVYIWESDIKRNTSYVEEILMSLKNGIIPETYYFNEYDPEIREELK